MEGGGLAGSHRGEEVAGGGVCVGLGFLREGDDLGSERFRKPGLARGGFSSEASDSSPGVSASCGPAGEGASSMNFALSASVSLRAAAAASRRAPSDVPGAKRPPEPFH